MALGDDRLTFENENGNAGQRSDRWFFNLYGRKANQTFYDYGRNTFGTNGRTLRVGVRAVAPADVVELGAKSTPDLLADLKSADADRAFYVRQVLAERTVILRIAAGTTIDANADRLTVKLKARRWPKIAWSPATKRSTWSSRC